MKKVSLILIMLLAAAALFAGGQAESAAAEPAADQAEVQSQAAEPVVLKVVSPTGHPAVSLAGMITDTPELPDNVSLEFDILESPDLLSARVISGDADIFMAPTNLGVNLYNKGIEIQDLGSVVWGILYIVTTEDISSWEGLRGREINMLGRGMTPDIVMRYLLKANGLDPEKDVILNYVQNTTELAPAVITGKASISIMPEPALSMVRTKKSDVKIMLDLQDEWAKASGTPGSYPQASLFAKTEVVEKYPAVISAFVDAYAASIGAINSDPAAAGLKAATYLNTPPAKIIAKSIPGGNMKWVSALEARDALELYIGVLIEANPKSVGGKLPDDEFYYAGS